MLKTLWKIYKESAINSYTGTYSLENNGIIFNVTNAWAMLWCAFWMVSVEGMRSPLPISYDQMPIIAGAIVIVAGVFGTQLQIGRSVTRNIDKDNHKNEMNNNVV